MTRVPCFAGALLLALAACSPAAPPVPSPAASASPTPAETPAAPASADPREPVNKPEHVGDFMGSWKVTAWTPGPWYDGQGPKPDPDPEVMGKTVTFTPTGATGMREANCEKPVYTVTEVGPDYLFEGGLNENGRDPAKEAAKLGFTTPRFLSMFESCLSSAGDMEMSYAMVDPDTLVLGMNNVVYTFKRVTK